MEAGRLDQRITLQRPAVAVARDGTTRAAGWEDVARPWAEVVTPSSRQRFEAPMPIPAEAASVRIRWRREIDMSWRLLWEGRAYRITGISYRGRRREIILTVEREGLPK